VPPNTSLQRTRRQSLRSFLLAAELDIVSGHRMNTLRNLLVSVGAVALPERAVNMLYNLLAYPFLFHPGSGPWSTNQPLWLLWCIATSCGAAVVAGFLCGAVIQSDRPERWCALLVLLIVLGGPLDAGGWLSGPHQSAFIFLGILVASALLAVLCFYIGRARSLTPRTASAR
jgi:hypothetical protein